jgi:hypothetical protein
MWQRRDEDGEKDRRGGEQRAARATHERREGQSGDRVDRRDVPVPHQHQVHEANDEQRSHSARDVGPKRPSRLSRAFELDGEADAEEEREERERLELHGRRHETIDEAVEGRPVGGAEELREDRHAQLREQVHEEHAEQRDGAHDVEVGESIAVTNRREPRRHAAS